MSQKHIQAFQAFSKAVPGAFKTHEESWGLYVHWQDHTYIIQSAEQIRDAYRHYVTGHDGNGPSYSEIYTETHVAFWDHLWEDCQVETDELILYLYLEWKRYWQSIDIKGGEERTELFIARSYRDFQILQEIIKLDDSNLVRVAHAIEEMEIYPVAAMAIVRQYRTIDSFLDDALLALHETGEVTLSMDGKFSVEYVGEEKEGVDTRFFIYTPFLDFAELLEIKKEEGAKPRRGRPRTSN